MIYITLKNYNKIYANCNNIFENQQKHKDMEHLVGKRTMLSSGHVLEIESVGFEIIENFKRDFIMNNGETAKFIGCDDWSNCLFNIQAPSGKTIRVVFLEEHNKMYSIYGDWDEPNRPLKSEYQIQLQNLEENQQVMLDDMEEEIR